MARFDRENGKLVAGLAIGAAIVGLNFMRNRKSIRPVSDEIADMAKQGVENVRRHWSERVREATGGAEDLKGKPFWVAAGLALATTLISACVDEAKKQAERKAENARKPAPPPALNYEEWRATKPAGKVYDPQPLPGAVFEEIVNTIQPTGRTYVSAWRVSDPAVGDDLTYEYSQGRGSPRFMYRDPKQGVQIRGTFRHPHIGESGIMVFEITSAKTWPGMEPASTLDVARLGQMFRAYREAGRDFERKKHPNGPSPPVPKVVVVDSRAEFTDDDIRREFPS